MFRTIIITTLLLCGSMLVRAQSNQRLTLDNCYELAQKNYPLIGQYELLEKIKELSLENTSRGYLPQLTISGYATYQSEVTSVPISLPNINIPTVDKDQYRIYAEVSQSVTDLFSTMKHQKENIRLSTEVEKQRTAVELHKIKERVSELYFSILLVNTQLEQNEIVKKDIEQSIKKNDAAIANGVALKSSADVLQAELLSVKQQTVKLEATKKGLVDMLSLFVGQPLDNQVVLEEPMLEIIDTGNNRPELLLYESQKKSYENQKKLINDKSLPKFSLFVQGGYGKPSLNMFSTDFDTYYMGGVRLNWNLSSLYTHKKEKKILVENQQSVDIQKKTFLFNTEASLKQKQADIEKLYALIEADKEVITLREKVKLTAQNQLEYGTITLTDYLSHLHAEDQAKQSLILNEIQLLKAKNEYILLKN